MPEKFLNLGMKADSLSSLLLLPQLLMKRYGNVAFEAICLSTWMCSGSSSLKIHAVLGKEDQQFTTEWLKSFISLFTLQFQLQWSKLVQEISTFILTWWNTNTVAFKLLKSIKIDHVYLLLHASLCSHLNGNTINKVLSRQSTLFPMACQSPPKLTIGPVQVSLYSIQWTIFKILHGRKKKLK